MFDSLFPKEWTTIQRLMWLKTNALARAVYEIITGNPVSFTAKAAPLKQLKVAFSPVQEGTGDPSPDNVRPILGWDSLNVEQTGKNLFDGTYENWIVTTADGSTFYPAADANARTAVFPIKGGQKYTVSRSGGNRFSIYESVEYPQTGAAHPVKTLFNNSTSTEATVTTSANARYLLVYVTTSVSTAPVTSLQCEIGETATEYVPYNPASRTISITLGQTVYSGTVDVVTGVVTVTMASVDLGTLNWGLSGGYFISRGINDSIKRPASATAVPNALCSMYLVTYWNNTTDKAVTIQPIGLATENPYLWVKDTAYASAADFKTAVTGQTLVYELATHIPIQLTPQEVQSLAGDNVLFSDANGDLTVEYRRN